MIAPFLGVNALSFLTNASEGLHNALAHLPFTDFYCRLAGLNLRTNPETSWKVGKVAEEDLFKGQCEVAKAESKFPKSRDQFLAFAGRNAHLRLLRGVGLSDMLEVKLHLKLGRILIKIKPQERKSLVIDKPRNMSGAKGHAPIKLRKVFSQLVLGFQDHSAFDRVIEQTLSKRRA